MENPIVHTHKPYVAITMCDDCMFLAANGDMPNDSTPERDAEITTGFDNIDGHVIVDCGSDADHDEFSATPCDVCGTTLAGSRNSGGYFNEKGDDVAVREYRVLSLDVWGNEDDGFEVNAAYKTSVKIRLSDDAQDKDILRALEDAGALWRADELKEKPLTELFEVEDGDLESYTTVSDTDNSKPLIQFMPELFA